MNGPIVVDTSITNTRSILSSHPLEEEGGLWCCRQRPRRSEARRCREDSWGSSVSPPVEGSASALEEAVVESVKAAKYYAGQGLLVRMSAVFDPSSTGSCQLIGYGCSQDGMFIGMNGGVFGVFYRKDGVTEFVPQSDFNIDKLDGTGSSGMLHRPEKGNVYQIQVQWHGFGNINFYIEEPDTGTYILFHVYRHTNNFETVTFTNPILPLHGHIINNSGSSPATLRLGACAIFNEGRINRVGPTHYFENSRNSIDPNWNHMLTIRNRKTFHSLDNRSNMYIKRITIMNDHFNPTYLEVLRNCVMTGESYSYFHESNSLLEYDSVGIMNSMGDKVSGALVPANGTIVLDEELLLVPGQTLGFRVKTAAGKGALVNIGIQWQDDL